MSKNLNYELLLDDLVEEMLLQVKGLDEELIKSNVRGCNHALKLGLRDGIMRVVVGLHMKEIRSKKYIIGNKE